MAEGRYTAEKERANESSFYTNTAPTGDDTLQPDDAVIILEELLEARNDSHTFGLKLNLPVHEVEAIFTKYSDPRDRLLQIIIAFLRRAKPRPTWRVIVAALRSDAVGLTALARRVEAAHFPDLAATRDVVPETTGKSLSVPLTCMSHFLSFQSLHQQPIFMMMVMRSSQNHQNHLVR